MTHQQHFIYDDSENNIHISVEAPNDLYPHVLALVTSHLLQEIGIQLGSSWLNLRSDMQGYALSAAGTRIEAPHLLNVVEQIFNKELKHEPVE